MYYNLNQSLDSLLLDVILLQQMTKLVHWQGFYYTLDTAYSRETHFSTPKQFLQCQ